MRYCGIDVTAHPGHQQLVTLHERRSADGLDLVATFYEAGSVEQVRRTIEGFGRGQAIVGVAARRVAHQRSCDRLLTQRNLPILDGHSPIGFELFEALEPLGPYRPRTNDAWEGRADASHGRVFETCPQAAFCTLLGHRAPARGTPYGMQQRIAALRLKGVVDADGGLWHRTPSELDAGAAAFTAFAVGAGVATWHGDPAEGVLVLPVAELLEHYEMPPPAHRHPLA